MDLGISGKKAIVCASSRGLGKACAKALVQNGVSVVINGQTPEILEATAAELSAVAADGATVTPVRASVTDPEGQKALLDACPDPDILVNNNGGPPLKNFRELERDAMLEGVTMNMVAPIELTQAVIDGMCERKFGRIVNITSLSVKMPIFGLDLSSGARAGLTAFMAGVARSVAEHNVTINGLLPGFMDTDRFRGGLAAQAKMTGRTEAEILADREAQIPARRAGTPDEFGSTCAFLCSAPAAYITGQNLLVDGGVVNASF